MAKKAFVKKENYAKSDANSVYWHNVTLSDEDISSLEGWINTNPDLLVEFVALVSGGYAVGCKPAANGDGFMATIISGIEPGGIRGNGLSAYSDTPFNALAAVLFKFVTVLGGTFPPPSDPVRRKFR